MFKKAILFLSAALFIGNAASAQTAQPCSTDQHKKDQVRRYPQISNVETKLENDIQDYVKEQMFGPVNRTAAKGTSHWDTITQYNTYHPAQDFRQFNIPVVFHVIHNYGSEYITDNKIFDLITRLNIDFNKRNGDTSAV